MATTRRGGWRQWTEREARAVLAELASWRGTVEQFVRAKGISRRRIEYWRKRLAGTKPPAFVAVSLPTRAAGSARTAERIEIVTRELTVRVREDLETEHLARIVDVLERRRSGGC